jgi:uncharacterized protein YndB with AHSA1/START domain
MTGRNKLTFTAEPGKQECFMTREFEAPRELVFKAMTDPELFVQWIGPRGYVTRLETFEPVSGGRYRYIQTGTDGNEYGFKGSFHEISIERIIQTFEFEGLPERGHVVMDCMSLLELPGNRTRLNVQSVFRSAADRDGMIESGMENGVVDSYDRMDEIFETIMVHERKI